MKIKEIKKILEEEIGKRDFFELLCEDIGHIEKINEELTLEVIDCLEEEDVTSFIFKVNDKLYRSSSLNDSWAGANYEDIFDFVEVSPVQVTVTQYHPVRN